MPPAWTSDPTDPAKVGFFHVRGANWEVAQFTSMLVADFTAPNRKAAGIRFSPGDTYWNSQNPDFPQYPDFNHPCKSWAVQITTVQPTDVLDPSDILQPGDRLLEPKPTPDPVTGEVEPCPAAAPASNIATLISQGKATGPQMVNVGQFEVPFRMVFRIKTTP